MGPVTGWVGQENSRVASGTLGQTPIRAQASPTKDSLWRTGLQGDSEATLQDRDSAARCRTGWPIALEPPPEAGGPMPGGLGRVSPEECPLPAHLCPQLATHAAGMPGWEWGAPT